MKPRRFVSITALTALVIGSAACGSSTKDATKAEQTTTTAIASDKGVTVEGAWARMSPSGVTLGAAYLTLTSATDDKLVGVSVDNSVAARAEIHEMAPAGTADHTTPGDSTMGSDHAKTTMKPGTTAPAMSSDTTMPMSGQMVMRQIESLDLPAGKAVELKPGGYHIMLIDLAKPLTVGTTITMTLSFDKADPVTVDVPVKEG